MKPLLELWQQVTKKKEMMNVIKLNKMFKFKKKILQKSKIENHLSEYQLTIQKWEALLFMDKVKSVKDRRNLRERKITRVKLNALLRKSILQSLI